MFHCTANSMESGRAHEKALIEIIEQASGCPTITTAQAITQAFDQSGIKKLVLVSPYVQSTNQLEVNYLSEVGYQVLHEVGRRLAAALRPGDTVARLGGDEFGLVLENVA